MHLFIVLYIFGQMQSQTEIVPPDMNVCQQQAQQLRQICNAKPSSEYSCDQAEWRCEWH